MWILILEEVKLVLSDDCGAKLVVAGKELWSATCYITQLQQDPDSRCCIGCGVCSHMKMM